MLKHRKRRNSKRTDIKIDGVRRQVVDNLIFKILDESPSKYLTADIIAGRIKKPKDLVVASLSSNRDKIRVSLAKDDRGAELFASKKRVSTLGDVWTAFKALNNSKYGGHQ